jgi:hypothetical protein
MGSPTVGDRNSILKAHPGSLIQASGISRLNSGLFHFGQLPAHGPELQRKNIRCDTRYDYTAPSAKSSNHGPKPCIARLWIITLVCLCAPIAGVAVYQIDKRRPHPSWVTVVPMLLFAILAIVCRFQLTILAQEMLIL